MFPVGRKRGLGEREVWKVCEAHGKGTPPLSSQHGQNQTATGFESQAGSDTDSTIF